MNMFDWNNSAAADKLSYLGQRLQSQQFKLDCNQAYYDGTQGPAYLSSDAVAQLNGALSTLSVNYCRLLVDALVQRITLDGFTVAGADSADPRLWAEWLRNNMKAELGWLLRDVFALGRGYVLAWNDPQGRPTLSVESPRQVVVHRDPVTRQIIGAVKQWSLFDDVLSQQQSWGVLYLPDEIVHFTAQTPAAVNSLPSNTWRVVERVPNPLGTVPIVEFSNRLSVLDFYGTPEFAPITGLIDALAKVTQDSMVASEYYSYPRRWITGLSVPRDDDGNPLPIFGTAWNDVWTTEDSEAHFGEFQAASLQGFDTLANMLTRQICAVSGIPDYMAGAGSANPVSSEAIQSADLQLNAKAQQKLDLLGPSFAQVGALLLALITGQPVGSVPVEPVFADLNRSGPAVATDSFTKLVSAGMPLHLAAKHALGMKAQDLEELKGITNVGSN